MWDNLLPKSFENFKIYRLGLEAYNLGDFKGAVKCFKKVIETEPETASSWYMILESLSYLGNWEEIIELGEKAVKINPNFGPSYSWLGDAYYQQGKKTRALTYYKKGLNLLEKDLGKYPKNDTILNGLGEINIRLGNYEEAIKYSKRASSINPKNENHLHSIGLAYKEMGDFDKAIEFYKKSLSVNPMHGYAWFDLGLIYENLNELKKAIECFEKAVESKPQWIKLREKLLEMKSDSVVLLKKSPDVRILFNEEIDQNQIKSDVLFNDLNEIEEILKKNKLTLEERKYYEQRKRVLIKELEIDAESRQDKLIQLKKLLSQSSDLMQKIKQKSNKKKEQEHYQKLKTLSHIVEEKRKDIYKTNKSLKSTLLIPLSELSPKELSLLWELMKFSASDSTEFMELLKQETDFYKDMSEKLEVNLEKMKKTNIGEKEKFKSKRQSKKKKEKKRRKK